MCSFVVPDAKQFGIKKIQVDEQIGMTYEIWKTPNIECTRESGRIQQWITISFRNGYNLAQLGAETASAMCVAGGNRSGRFAGGNRGEGG